MNQKPHEKVADLLQGKLGGTWTQSIRNSWSLHLIREDGLTLVVSEDQKSPKKVKVAPFPPKIPGDSRIMNTLQDWRVLREDESAPRTSFLGDRADVTILKTVRANVLTPYEDIYQRILKDKAERQQILADRQVLIERVAIAMGLPAPEPAEPRDVVLYGRRGDVPLMEATISAWGQLVIKAEVSGETGLAVIEVLKAAHQKPGAS